VQRLTDFKQPPYHCHSRHHYRCRQEYSSGEAQGENWIGFGEDQGKEKEAEEEFHRYNSSARGCMYFGGEKSNGKIFIVEGNE
jgi:hypothetical protein